MVSTLLLLFSHYYSLKNLLKYKSYLYPFYIKYLFFHLFFKIFMQYKIEFTFVLLFLFH